MIVGGRNDDKIDGGAGVDTADYSDAMRLIKEIDGSLGLEPKDQGITLDLNTSNDAEVIAGDTNVGADTVKNIENVVGTNGKDNLTGDSEANALYGGDGNDDIQAGSNSDTVDGGDGNDEIDLGADSAKDILVLSEGEDTVSRFTTEDKLEFNGERYDLSDSEDIKTLEELDVILSGENDGEDTVITHENGVTTLIGFEYQEPKIQWVDHFYLENGENTENFKRRRNYIDTTDRGTSLVFRPGY